MANSPKDGKLATASVLAFERKLDPSDAVMYSGKWTDIQNASGWAPIHLNEKKLRGTISNRRKTTGSTDAANLDADIANPNLQTVDSAALAPTDDTLKVSFSLRVLGGTGTPNACNNLDYQSKLLNVVKAYADAHQFQELAMRYAHNLANGRFLWRNRLSGEAVQVNIRHVKAGQAQSRWQFDALAFGLHQFDQGGNEQMKSLSQVLQSALMGEGYALLEVDAYVRMGAGLEVFPSQKLILKDKKEKNKKEDEKSKHLYSIGEQAAMHSQKIGNALRSIDTWYSANAEQGAIAIEPYGSVTAVGKAFRQPKDKLDFYTLLDNWILRDQAPAPEQQHYVIANLIRGGVYGESGKE